MWPQSHQFTNSFTILGIILLLTASFGQILAYESNIITETNSYGRMVPAHFINLPIGQYLDLFCSINIEKAKTLNYSIEDLVIFKEDQIIERSHITRVNKTTIQLHLENVQESVDMYYCYLQKNSSTESALTSTTSNIFINGHEALTSPASNIIPNSIMVGMTSVHVGPKPGKVENVVCISLNWQKLNCSWKVPETDVPTNYSITYSPKNRFTEKIPCPTENDTKKNFCLWTLWSMPAYRKNLATLNINITGRNQFGSIQHDFLFHQYKNVLLDPPKDVHLLAWNETSITLQWDIGQLRYFPELIDYKIQYNINQDSYWHSILYEGKYVIRDNQHVSYTISDLSPNKLYIFRVFMKSSVASDEYWSSASPLTYILLPNGRVRI